MQVTVQGMVFPDKEQITKIDDLMRIQSSTMRYSYSRLCEGKSKREIERDLRNKFHQINSRYREGGYFRARDTYKSAKERVKIGELESEEKVVFGGRKSLKKREKDKITNEEWKRLRNKQVFSRGDKTKTGNLNLRFMEKNEKTYLRINVGYHKWIYVSAYISKYEDRLLKGKEDYGVRIIRVDGKYRLRINIENGHKEKIGFEKGAVGLDFNHSTIDLAVTNEQGQLKDTKSIDCHVLTCSKEGKRDWHIGNFAKKVVNYAKYWKRGLVIEKLSDLTRNQSNSHIFTHRKFLEGVKRRAEKEGVKVKEVNPAYTSVIGKYKYQSYYYITVHQAAALVIARRGQGFSEHLRGLKTPLLEALEAGEKGENVPTHRVHSWSLWRLMKNLPLRKGVGYTHLGQSSIGVESQGTSIPAERCQCLGRDDISRRKTVIPSSGPPEKGVKSAQHY